MTARVRLVRVRNVKVGDLIETGDGSMREVLAVYHARHFKLQPNGEVAATGAVYEVRLTVKHTAEQNLRLTWEIIRGQNPGVLTQRAPRTKPEATP